MKDTLKSQLDLYKRDNTESSKDAILSTMNSITNTATDNDSSIQSSVEAAKKALTASKGNKGEIVQSVEDVISRLK